MGRPDLSGVINPPGSREIRLAFPVQLPGATIDRLTVDLDRVWRVASAGAPAINQIARIAGLPAPVLKELSEFDYVKLLITIDELNTPRCEMSS